VYFLTVRDNQNLAAIRVSVPDGVPEVLTPSLASTEVAVLPSSSAADAQARVIYCRSPRGPAPVTFWQEETDPSTARTFPTASFGTSGPRWIPKERAIVTNVLDANGVTQIARHDIDADTTTILTQGPRPKNDGFFFHAPEFNDDSVFLCVMDSSQIGIYRQVASRWMPVHTIDPPLFGSRNERPIVASADPFVYRGKSYVVYLSEGRNQTAICVAALDGSVNGVISAPSQQRKLDPEAVVLGDRLWVYYWINDSEHSELHACHVRISR
jgi:hypothetical protein